MDLDTHTMAWIIFIVIIIIMCVKTRSGYAMFCSDIQGRPETQVLSLMMGGFAIWKKMAAVVAAESDDRWMRPRVGKLP